MDWMAMLNEGHSRDYSWDPMLTVACKPAAASLSEPNATQSLVK
jgi:hypothetical protein